MTLFLSAGRCIQNPCKLISEKQSTNEKNKRVYESELPKKLMSLGTGDMLT